MNPESGLAGDPGPLGTYSDAARRVSDAITLHLLADGDGNFGKWLAFRLSDGTSDGVVYDDPVAAADHQLHYKQCAYIQIHRGGLSAKGAQVMLTYYRTVFDNDKVPPTLVAYQRAKLIRPGRTAR
jgi:hypothetical protein